jgi:hypothetical protein
LFINAALDVERSTFSEMFEFPYQANFSVCVPGGRAWGQTETCFDISMCDKSLDALKQGAKANCLQIASPGGTSNLFKNVTYAFVDSSSTASYETAENFGGFSRDITNQLQFISATHPFVLVHDIEKGTWTYSIK